MRPHGSVSHVETRATPPGSVLREEEEEVAGEVSVTEDEAGAGEVSEVEEEVEAGEGSEAEGSDHSFS